jgi:hypothetical protein
MDEQPTTATSTNEPLTYEETPVITPIPEPVVVKKPNKILGFFKGLLFFIILFIVGFVLSGYLRDFLSGVTTEAPSPTPMLSQTEPLALESTDAGIVEFPTPEATPATPITYSVLNGLTRQPITDISFTLPPSVLSPICDGSACGSQGTYLPGGTRFTVAARGTGQVLADFRGKIISDAGGKPFTIKTTTIAGKPATEFTTSQTGSTIGGYAFSQMHGYMIEVNDTLSLEINHFSPSGITADFAADEIVFNTIVRSLLFGGMQKESIIPTITPIP